MEPDELRLSSVVAMKAMAHPLRLRIVGSLRVDGPATASVLARRLGTDSGQTSHHLRLLDRAGFVEEANDLGKGPRGRERWWRAAQETTSWDDLSEVSEEGALARGAMDNAVHEVWHGQLTEFRAQGARDEWGKVWLNAASSGDYPIRTTPDGLTALVAELREVIARHDLDAGFGSPTPVSSEQTSEDIETVVVLMHAFPRRTIG